MTAQKLRDAAARIREAAPAAGTRSTGRISWSPGGRIDGDYAIFSDEGAEIATAFSDGTAAHIVLWHPPVALAVADWLDATAEARERHLTVMDSQVVEMALALADLILGGAW